MSDDSPAGPGHLAFVDRFRELGLCRGKVVQEHDSLLLCYPGTPDSRYFNTMFRTRPLMPAPDAVRTADEFFSGRSRGYSIVARRGIDEDLIPHARDLGATVTTEHVPLTSVCEPLPAPMETPGIDIRPLTGGEEHAFVDLACTIFDTTEADRAVSRVVLDDPSLLTLPHVHVVLAYENGQPVGTGMARLSHGVGYLSWICTLPAERRRGLGAALTARLTDTLFARGAAEVFLDASAAGEPLYRAMGFVDRAEYCRLYRPLA